LSDQSYVLYTDRHCAVNGQSGGQQGLVNVASRKRNAVKMPLRAHYKRLFSVGSDAARRSARTLTGHWGAKGRGAWGRGHRAWRIADENN
jgi:hypothetical protein